MARLRNACLGRFIFMFRAEWYVCNRVLAHSVQFTDMYYFFNSNILFRFDCVIVLRISPIIYDNMILNHK